MKKWYGIVDGHLRHEAIMMLVDTNESSAGFWWDATMVKLGPLMESY